MTAATRPSASAAFTLADADRVEPRDPLAHDEDDLEFDDELDDVDDLDDAGLDDDGFEDDDLDD